MLKNASEVTLVPKIFFFLKIFNFVKSFVGCKVSLTDGSRRDVLVALDGWAIDIQLFFFYIVKLWNQEVVRCFSFVFDFN